MSSLVEELQKDALNHSMRVTELLHKSLVVATKLKLDEFASWVQLELDGYGEKEVPEYRILHGSPQVFHPYHGYQPLYCGDAKFAETISKMHFNTPLGQIEDDLINARKSGSSEFRVQYSPAHEKMLMDAMNFRLQPTLHMNASQSQGILDAVRKIILEWSLKLQEDGITGEGMSFSREEKERAQAVTYNIKNLFQGNIQDSQIQIEATDSAQTKCAALDIDQLMKLVTALKATTDIIGLDEKDKEELGADIDTLEAQIKSPNPKNPIIGECLGSVKQILEGASGNLVASGLLYELGKILGA